MKKLKYFAFALAASALAFTFTACNNDDDGPAVLPPVVDPPVQTWENAPEIAPPGEGYFTLAIATPVGTCDEIILVGDAFGWTDNPGPDQLRFERVDGTDTWFKVTIPSSSEGWFKPMALNEEGRGNWDWQWGRNNREGQVEPEVFFYPGSEEVGELVSDGGATAVNTDTDMRIAYEGEIFADNSVAFVVIRAWRVGAPCIPPPPVDPTTDWTVQIHGDAVYPGGGWTQINAEFTSAENGVYVFTMPTVNFVPGAFGMRIQVDGNQWNDGTSNWWSFGTDPAVEITGDTGNFSGTGNITVGTAREYTNVVITIARDTEAEGPITSFRMYFPAP